MKNSTGLHPIQFQDLLDLLAASPLAVRVPPILGLTGAVNVTLKYFRQNRTQADIAEGMRVSQPTVSRAITAVTDAISDALYAFIPTAEDIQLSSSHLRV